MKRRLAFLLALSLTFASFPVAGAGAAETTDAAGTQVVTEVEQEEISGEGVSVEEEVVDPTNEVKDETAGEEGTTKSQETTQTEEETADNEVVSDGTAADVNTDAVEDAAEGMTENAAAGITDTEVAAVVEPEEVAVVVAPVEAEVVKEDKKAIATTPAATNTVQPRWIYEGGNWYYVTSTGARATGITSIQGVRYYFGKDGKMVTGWVYDNGSWYYFNDSGAMRTGWLYDGGEWYYLDANTGKMAKGIVSVAGTKYYFNNSGVMKTGWIKHNNYWYYFNRSGEMRKGWLYSKGTWYFFNLAYGTLITKRFVPIQGVTYYFDQNGAMATGWKKINGGWYLFDGSGAMKKGWAYDKGYWYLLDLNTGKMMTGWQKYQGAWYYLNPAGDMVKGWKKINGNWYYFNEAGAETTGWVKTGSTWYYVKSNGVMATHWQEIKGSWYYFDPSTGAMATAPRYCVSAYKGAHNDYYFFYENGKLGTGKGWKKNGGYEYYTTEEGILYRNTTVDGKRLDEYGRSGDAMDKKAQGYSSNTNYLILVDKSTFKVRVYKGSKGNWVKIKDWICTHGGSDTPNGVWVLDDHVTKRDATWGWADFDFSSAAFACHLSAGNYFHSILFDKGTRGNPYNQGYRILDDELRTTYSHGCIRLELENAEWIWDNIPFGTKVVVYNS